MHFWNKRWHDAVRTDLKQDFRTDGQTALPPKLDGKWIIIQVLLILESCLPAHPSHNSLWPELVSTARFNSWVILSESDHSADEDGRILAGEGWIRLPASIKGTDRGVDGARAISLALRGRANWLLSGINVADEPVGSYSNNVSSRRACGWWVPTFLLIDLIITKIWVMEMEDKQRQWNY